MWTTVNKASRGPLGLSRPTFRETPVLSFLPFPVRNSRHHTGTHPPRPVLPPRPVNPIRKTPFPVHGRASYCGHESQVRPMARTRRVCIGSDTSTVHTRTWTKVRRGRPSGEEWGTYVTPTPRDEIRRVIRVNTPWDSRGRSKVPCSSSGPGRRNGVGGPVGDK